MENTENKNDVLQTDEETGVSEKEKKEGFFSKLYKGLTKTRKNIVYGLDTVFGAYDELNDDFFDELEELLIMGDVGVSMTEEVLEELRAKIKDERIHSPADCRQALIDFLSSRMQTDESMYEFEDGPTVVLIIGVNGVGKTTFAGKLASKLKNKGKKVILAAADTFRAAAAEQLIQWGERAGVEVISGQEGADPASVIYDALHAAKARKADILLCDTAGRLNNKKNLMKELEKIDRIISRELPEHKRETLIVLDATTGQNALSQARDFAEAANITGIVLTKMDGTSKGGIAIAIEAQMDIPVKYIGIGEQPEDIMRFDPEAFVKALFAKGDADE